MSTFEPVHGFALANAGRLVQEVSRSTDGTHIEVCTSKVVCKRNRLRGDKVTPCLVLPLALSASVRERMARAIYLRDARTHIEVTEAEEELCWMNASGDLFDEAMQRADVAYAALVGAT